MTLVAALSLSNKVVIASDSVVIVDGQATVAERKLYEAPAYPKVAWGFAGAQPAGYEFEAWINGTAYTAWWDLAVAAREEVARINGNVRRLAMNAGATSEPVDVLIAGYIGTDQGVLYLDDEGGATMIRRQFVCIGSTASAIAYVAWDAVTRLAGKHKIDPEAAMSAVMNAVVADLPLLGGPVRFKELTP
jgi:hypothetical protein